MPVLITPVDPTHPDAITCLRAYFADLAAVIPDMPDRDSFVASGEEQLRAPHGTFLIAYEGPQPIGCVGLRRDGGTMGEVKRLWVSESARGAALGKTLMMEVEDAARALSFTHLRLDTSRHLPGAIAFYRRLGWAEIARYNDNPYAHHFFEKPIGT